MHLFRQAESVLVEMLATGKICMVLGARQVGKTTLVRHVLRGRQAEFLNFDLDIDQARFRAVAALRPTDAWQSMGRPAVMVIDEAQRYPDVARIVKGWYDARLPVQILLLGSSSLQLLDQSAETLTGRNRKLALPPLLFHEILGTQPWATGGGLAPSPDPQTSWNSTISHVREHFGPQLRTCLLRSMAFGAYPEAVLDPHPVQVLRELSADYLWKDILQGNLVKSSEAIRRLLTLLAHQLGSEVSVNELSTQLAMARATVERYLDLLEQTFVIFRLPSYSTNARKEIAKSKKIYFWDTGIRNALLNSFSTDPLRVDIGMLWENWVVAEVAKSNVLTGKSADLYFWRSKTQSEVDLVVKHDGRLRAFEIKWSNRKVNGRAFYDAYAVNVELLSPDNPFVGDLALKLQ